MTGSAGGAQARKGLLRSRSGRWRVTRPAVGGIVQSLEPAIRLLTDGTLAWAAFANATLTRCLARP
jgi:hypothetical protein